MKTVEKSYTSHSVTAPDDVTLSVQEWGNSEGPAILFIHGFSQPHMKWQKQVQDPQLAREFRMITFDLRGHGMSDKPEDARYYRDGERWAGDVATIIESLDLADPVLVASSMGGRVVGDYVAHHGEAGIGGLVFVSAILMDDATRWFGPATKHLVPMASAELGTAINATRHFVESYFVTVPSEDEVCTLIACNMTTPHHVRKALLGREADYERHWRGLTVPVLLFHGVEDQVIDLGMSENAARLFEHAQTSYIDDMGHVPFLEIPERFNAELAEFVRKVGEV
ncbi:MAG: alpha/beta fold hydrolase [Chloroflexota bacterium]